MFSDKGKRKGYGSPNPWGSYAPFQSKGKSKDLWGGPEGVTKGGKGAYLVEQEWFPDPSWYGSWDERREEEYHMLNLGQPEQP